jgi:ribonuclease BN (tRNA processing enzyme)
VTFMGTAGARFMVAKQLAASGGLYVEDQDARISLDPGPGAIVQYAKRKVDLTKLDAIVVSHRHLDRCATCGIFQKRS